MPFSLQQCPPPHRYQIVHEDQPSDGVFAVVCRFDPFGGSLYGAAGLATLIPRRPISQLKKLYKKTTSRQNSSQTILRFEKEIAVQIFFIAKQYMGLGRQSYIRTDVKVW